MNYCMPRYLNEGPVGKVFCFLSSHYTKTLNITAVILKKHIQWEIFQMLMTQLDLKYAHIYSLNIQRQFLCQILFALFYSFSATTALRAKLGGYIYQSNDTHFYLSKATTKRCWKGSCASHNPHPTVITSGQNFQPHLYCMCLPTAGCGV